MSIYLHLCLYPSVVYTLHIMKLRNTDIRWKQRFENYRKVLKTDGLSTGELLIIESELDELLLPYRIDILDYDSIDNPQLREHIDRAGLSLKELVET